MAIFRWNGNAGTGAFPTAGNWDPAATAPPGPGDIAIIANAATPITGTGTVQVLNFGGTNEVEGHLTASSGCPVNDDLTLLPGCILTTPRLHLVVDFGLNPPTTGIAKVTVGSHSRVVISGCNPPDTFAIQIAEEIPGHDSHGTLLVQGPHAVVNGGNQPMSVGQDGSGLLKITHGAAVSVGNSDPLKYPWALVIGNHAKSEGTVEVTHGLLQAHGQVIVGRHSVGKLHIHERGLVVAEDLAIGWAPESGQGDQGKGSVTVKGDDARLIVDNSLEIGHFGVGSLTVAEHGFVSAGIAININGALSLADGQVETMALGVSDGGTLTGHGTVTASAGFSISGNGTMTVHRQLSLVGDIDNAGAITVAAGGELRCFGPLDDSGLIELRANSVASLETVGSDQTVSFTDDHARLVLRLPNAFGGTIKGFGKHNSIELEAVATGHHYDTVDGILTLTGSAGDVAQLQMAGNYTDSNFHLTSGFPSVINFQ